MLSAHCRHCRHLWKDEQVNGSQTGRCCRHSRSGSSARELRDRETEAALSSACFKMAKGSTPELTGGRFPGLSSLLP